MIDTGYHGGFLSGASRLCIDPSILPSTGSGVRRGILTNFAGTMPDLSRNIDALLAAGIGLSCLFGPEHGMRGSAQAGASEPGGIDERTGLVVYDTYLLDGDALDALLVTAAVDEILVDLRDFGARFGTYLWSMFDVLVSAARLGIAVVVLDRPNPLGNRPANLTVIGIEPQGLPPGVADWVPPSPNLPTAESALSYPGTCLFEGTNVSEGRGTTRPFETVGAGWIDSRFAAALRERELRGVLFREVFFVPSFGKWAGQQVRGVQLHIVDRLAFEPLETGVTMLGMLAGLYPRNFEFLPPGEEGGRPFIDLLWGSDALRSQGDRDYADVLAHSPRADNPTSDLRLYDRMSWNSCTSGSRAVVC